MTLPPGFQFSQASLQDYADCPRRFQLRYLLKIAWPAVQSEPLQEHERFMRQGERFHRLVQQYFLGLPPEMLAAQKKDPDLALWWENFLQLTETLPSPLPNPRALPEITLSMPFAGYRLAAKFDLLLDLTPEKVLIYDWKTGRKRQRRDWLAERVQTRLYPFLLAHAGGRFNQGKPLKPEQIEMVYWFAAYPQQSERFIYNAAQHASDQADIETWIAEISSREADQFPLTAHTERCKFCVYRSLCERGTQAGEWSEMDAADEPAPAGEPELDFDQIGEIEF